ncbi:hypothetical protein [Bradyrhizobium sp. USDA 10063]
MATDLEVLAHLVRRYADGLPLPPVISRGDVSIRLTAWLGSLSSDQRACPMVTAMLLDHPAERPTVGEIASTLAARLAERQSS